MATVEIEVIEVVTEDLAVVLDVETEAIEATEVDLAAVVSVISPENAETENLETDTRK